MNYKNAYGEEKVYQFNEYILSYDKSERDRSCLTISKTQNGNIYVMSSLYDGSADVISLMLESLQKENKILRKNAEHNDKVVDKVNWENRLLKEVIEEVREYILNHELVEEKDHYVLNGNELLQILDKTMENKQYS